MTTTHEWAPPASYDNDDKTPAFDPNDPRYDVTDTEPPTDLGQGLAPDVIDDTLESSTDGAPTNVYDRIAQRMGRLSEGAAERKENRAAMKAKLIGFGKSALRISATTGAVIVGAPFVAVGGAGYLAYKGGQKSAELAKGAAQTIGSELKYAASELGADTRIAIDNVKESYQDTKESAIKFFKEKAQNAKDRKNDRLAKISGGFNRIKDNVAERASTIKRRRRALGARAVSVVDRARMVKNAAKSAWNETGDENQLY